MNQPVTRSLHIARLDLDLRGVDPAAAEAAVRALGPALGAALGPVLARTLPPWGHAAPPAPRIDAGSIASHARPAPEVLAAAMSHTIAQSVARHVAGSTP